MIPEQKLYQRIQEHIPGYHIRIENLTDPGTPDIMACYQGVVTFIELKIEIQGEVVLRKEQYAWGVRHAHHGGRAWVMAASGWKHSDQLYMWEFPRVQVIPRGTKYVKIISTPSRYGSPAELCSSL